MHKRKLMLRQTPALRMRLLQLRSIHPTKTSNSVKSSNNPKNVKLKYYLSLISTYIKRKSRMGNADKARVVVYIEFMFLALGTTVAAVLLLFPDFFMNLFLQEIEDINKREHLNSERVTLTTIVAAIIAIALLIWLIIVITLCQGVRSISPGRLSIWLCINSIPTITGIIILTILISLDPKSGTVHIPSILFLLYKVWSLYVVRCLRRDIKNAGPPDNFHALQYRPSRSHSQS